MAANLVERTKHVVLGVGPTWSTLLVVLLSFFGLITGACIGIVVHEDSGIVPPTLVDTSNVRSKFTFFRIPFPGRRPTSVSPHIASYVQKEIKEAMKDALRGPVGLPDFALAGEGA